MGEITNVVLFDKEPDGVASVRFGNAEAAKACVRLMDGRFFSGQKLEAYIADGGEKFKKSSEKKRKSPSLRKTMKSKLQELVALTDDL